MTTGAPIRGPNGARADARADFACPLCGYRGSAVKSACASCPAHTGCGNPCCPSCGYTAPAVQDSLMARTFLRWIRRREDRPAPAAPRTLKEAPVGATVRLGSFAGLSEDMQSRLLSYGLFEGELLRVVHHLPVPQVTVGETELALDPELESVIPVRALDSPR